MSHLIKIDSFSGKYDFLSNFSTAIVTLDDVEFATTEHAYQAAKSLDPDKRKILSLDFNPELSAGQAKRIGRNFTLRSDWEAVKIDVMRKLLVQKFANPRLREKLLATGEAELVEGNWWEDRWWGVCYGGLPEGVNGRKCRAWPHAPEGENHLGKLLMEVRAVL
jgi:ribA/ribD-fused uncharacterized protein